MKIRSFLPFGLIMSGVLGFVYACSAPDPGAIVYVPRNTQSSTGGQDSSTTTGPATEGGATDAGPTAPTTAFFAEGTYEAGIATDNSLNPSHNGLKDSNNNAIPSDGGYGNPAGMNCMDGNCHGGATPPGPPWTFAGTVYTNATTPAGAGVEVRVIDAKTGVACDTVFTDAQGNFFTSSQNTFPTNNLAGARNGSTSQTMATTAQNACNQNGCHLGGANPMLQ